MTIELDFDRPAVQRSAKAKTQVGPVPDAQPATARTSMTVGDLILLLEDVDPRAPVVIEGQYGGYVSVGGLTRVPLRFDVNSLEGFGPHDRAAIAEKADALAVVVRIEGRPDGFVE